MRKRDELLQLVKDRYDAARLGVNSLGNRQSPISEYLKGGIGTGAKHGVKKQSQLNIDLLLVAIEGQSAILTDTPVDIMVTPRTNKYDIDANIYQQVVNWVLEENDNETLRDQFQKFALISDVGIIKLRVVEERGRRSIKLAAVDPLFVHIDPLASCPDDISYLIEVTRWSKAELLRKYPKANVGNEDIVQDDEAMLAMNNGEERSGEDEDDKSYVHVYEMWDMTCDLEKYPNGLYSLSTEFDVLEDRENKYPCGIPYVFFSTYSVPDRIFGRGTFQTLKSIQNEMGTLFKRMSNITRLAGNPTLLLSKRAGLNPDSVTNKDGGVLTLDVDDVTRAMQWVYGPGISPAMLAYVDKLQYYFDTVSGWNDIMQGRGQINSSVPSGRSLEELQQSAQTRLRQMLRGIKNAYKHLGQKIIQVANDVMDAETVIRITGEDAKTVNEVLKRTYLETVKELINSGAETQEEIVDGLRVFLEEKGMNAEYNGKDMYLKVDVTRLGDPTEFAVKVRAGSDIPKNKQDVAAQASQLMQLGLIDPETYMDATDFPMKEKVMERMPGYQEFLQWKAAKAQAEQAQGGGQQAAPPIPGDQATMGQAVESAMQPEEQMDPTEMMPEDIGG